MNNPAPIRKIGIVGFGEVGRVFAAGLMPQVHALHVWDTNPAQLLHAQAMGVIASPSSEQLCAEVDLVISAVTASNTFAVAQSATLRTGQVYLDLNSASPGTKKRCSAVVQSQGAHYVEAGVMTSVPPYGIKVPMLLGGHYAATLALQLASFGMDAKVVSSDLGVASAIKMSRSIMIKGLEALVIESFTNARKYGVEKEVIATLEETFPAIDWHKQAAYFYSRVVQHGKRRAEEMREAAHTVAEAGIDPIMTSAIASKQQVIADFAKAGVYAGISDEAVARKDWQAFADCTMKATVANTVVKKAS
jgi:3-hydroxyisobutyrate dehydrogenase-like beta-hydroxyacid dehydrogenase